MGCLLGIGVGFYMGCRLLGVWPHWPPREDQDRFLVLVFPPVLALELLAVSPKLPRWLLGLLRLAVTVGAAPVLLFGSSYLTNFADPDTREWSLPQALLVLGCLAAALGMGWSLVALLRRKAPGISLQAAVALTCGGAAVTIMLSGYATGGQLGLPLAAVLAGVIVAALAVRVVQATTTWVGPVIANAST